MGRERITAWFLSFAFAGAAFAASGNCATAVVAEPFVLPDGSEHKGGKITLCDRPYNPVQSFLKTSVDGIVIGEFVTKPRHTERSAEHGDLVVFRRGADGRLRLFAYETTGGQLLDLSALKHVPRGPST